MSLLSRETWGPPLWRILHTLSRKAGNLANPILETDEAHAWMHCIRNLEFMLPCALCSSHVHSWVVKSNIGQLVNTRGYRRQDWIESFWWNMHNDANQRTNKPVFLKEDLKLYDNTDSFYTDYELIKRMVNTGIQQSHLQLSSAKAALKYLEVLKRMYGF